MESVVQRLDIFRWEDAYSASTAPSPGQRVRAVQQINDVAAQEVEVSGLRGGVVTQGMSQAGFLHKRQSKAMTTNKQMCI